MIERLTKRNSNGDVASHVDPKKRHMLFVNRLAAYEDSGLSPEEVQKMAMAKADGRLVVLPCKIGDEVWFLEKQLDIANGTCSTVISEYIVTEIRGNKYNPLWYMASSERCTHRDFHPTELGKTVFLSREEAEKAIAEIGGREDD